MSFYDILTIVIFLGLPVVSAVISAKEKKNKSKKPLQGGQEHGEDIKDIFKSILAEMNGETTAQQDEKTEEEPSRPWQEPVVEDDEEPSMTWEEPVPETPSQTKPWSEPVVIDPKPAPAAVQAPVVVAPVAAAPVAENSGMRVRETAPSRPEGLRPASRKVEEVSEKPVMEKIDPKKLIIYDAILNPKFKD
uniref:hypothetical protein n=1 Tax=Candidatus Cryptobacteroides bacterium TaxID=3085639 RepID=UPI0040296CF9